MKETEILLSYEGKKYTAGWDANNHNRIRLPDGTLLLVTSWDEKDQELPVPKEIVKTGSFPSSPPIILYANGIVQAKEIEPTRAKSTIRETAEALSFSVGATLSCLRKILFP